MAQTRRRSRLPRKTRRVGRKPSTAKPRYRRRARTAGGGLAAAVRAIVSRDNETKFRGDYPTYNSALGVNNLSLWTGFSSAIATTGEIMFALPSLTKGDANYQRSGNQISPTSLNLHLEFCATTKDNARAVDKTVHLFLLTSKGVKNLANFSAIPITQLLDVGNDTNTDFDGTNRKSMFPINKSEFTVIAHRTFRLVKGYGQIINSTAAGSVAVTDAVVTPSQSYRKMNFRIPTPKTLTYDTGSTLYPSNFAPFFVIGYTNNLANDTAPNSIDLMVTGFSKLYYKDD